jgi:hypothetical protein
LNKSSARVRLFILIGTLAQNGCVIHYPYPSKWVALDTSDTDKDHCAVLAGVYNERGESAEPFPKVEYQDGKPVRAVPHLSNYLFHYPYPHGMGSTTRVELSFLEPGAFAISAYDNQQLLAKNRFSEKESTYECYGNVAKIILHRGLDRGPMLGFAYAAVYLYKAADGSLVLKTDLSGFGLAYLLFPIGGGETQWYRFEPIPVAGQ